MQFVFFAAGAAVLEVHRALHKPPGDPDVEAIQKRETELKVALEAVHRELKAEKQQRERAQGAAKVLESEKASLHAQQAALQAQKASLLAEKAALEDQSKLLLRRFSDLEASAADLQSQNDGLLQQVESLKADSDAEVARTSAQLDELRTEVAAAVQSWTAGSLDAQAFLARMASLGVEVHVTAGDLPALPAPQQITPGTDLQLTMDASWTSKMQLVTDSRERMSRLLTAAAAREGSLPPRPAAALTFPTAKTPPRDAGMSCRLDMGGFSVAGLTPRSNQALLDLGSISVSEPTQPAAPAPQQKQPLAAIENLAPAPAPAQQKPFFAKIKGDKNGGKRSKDGIPKLEFAAFDSDEGFGSSSTRELMRL